jgi:quercetin dioxygenase-like cupin family protein
VGPDGATIQSPVGGLLAFKVRGEQTDGSLAALVNTTAAGGGPPLHVHANEDEAWYIIEGRFRFMLGEERHDAPAGSLVSVPRGTAHCFQNVGAEPARILVLFTPAGMERFFDRLAALHEGADIPEALRSTGREVGMEVVGPPLRS